MILRIFFSRIFSLLKTDILISGCSCLTWWCESPSLQFLLQRIQNWQLTYKLKISEVIAEEAKLFYLHAPSSTRYFVVDLTETNGW